MRNIKDLTRDYVKVIEPDIDIQQDEFLRLWYTYQYSCADEKVEMVAHMIESTTNVKEAI